MEKQNIFLLRIIAKTMLQKKEKRQEVPKWLGLRLKSVNGLFKFEFFYIFFI